MVTSPKVIIEDDSSKEMYLGNESDNNDVNNRENTKSQKCSDSDKSDYCVCHRSCLPNNVYTLKPCQCIEISDVSARNEIQNNLSQTNESQNSVSQDNGSFNLISQDNSDKANVPPLFYNSPSVFSNDLLSSSNQLQNYMPSTCSNMCAPYLPYSENPCICNSNNPYTKSEV